MNKRQIIKSHVIDMLNDSREAMLKNLDRVLDSGAVDIDAYDPKVNGMIIPKCIVTALLEKESTQYNGSGTSFEKKVKKEVRNIRYFV